MISLILIPFTIHLVSRFTFLFNPIQPPRRLRDYEASLTLSTPGQLLLLDHGQVATEAVGDGSLCNSLQVVHS